MIYTILFAFLGAMLFKKMKIPVGPLLGSLFAVAFYQLCANDATLPTFTKDLLQIVSGMVIGHKMTKTMMKHLKQLWKPYICMMTVMMGVLMVMSYLLEKMTRIDLLTALFALAPGGATDLTILSADFGANMSYVAMIHTCRKVLIMVLVPVMAKTLSKETFVALKKEQPTTQHSFLTVFLCASIFGYLLDSLNMKAGLMMGSLLASSMYKLFISDYQLPKQTNFVLQVFAGAFIGTTINIQLLSQLSSVWIAVIFVLLETMLMMEINQIVLHRYFKLSKLTALLSSTPGGLSDMTILCEELGGDLPTVATLQILRMFSIVMVISWLASFCY